jgi:hypothetical protein
MDDQQSVEEYLKMKKKLKEDQYFFSCVADIAKIDGGTNNHSIPFDSYDENIVKKLAKEKQEQKVQQDLIRESLAADAALYERCKKSESLVTLPE